MDSALVDRLARRVAASQSRRRIVGALVSGVLGGLAVRPHGRVGVAPVDAASVCPACGDCETCTVDVAQQTGHCTAGCPEAYPPCLTQAVCAQALKAPQYTTLLQHLSSADYLLDEAPQTLILHQRNGPTHTVLLSIYRRRTDATQAATLAFVVKGVALSAESGQHHLAPLGAAIILTEGETITGFVFVDGDGHAAEFTLPAAGGAQAQRQPAKAHASRGGDGRVHATAQFCDDVLITRCQARVELDSTIGAEICVAGLAAGLPFSAGGSAAGFTVCMGADATQGGIRSTYCDEEAGCPVGLRCTNGVCCEGSNKVIGCGVGLCCDTGQCRRCNRKGRCVSTCKACEVCLPNPVNKCVPCASAGQKCCGGKCSGDPCLTCVHDHWKPDPACCVAKDGSLTRCGDGQSCCDGQCVTTLFGICGCCPDFAPVCCEDGKCCSLDFPTCCGRVCCHDGLKCCHSPDYDWCCSPDQVCGPQQLACTNL